MISSGMMLRAVCLLCYVCAGNCAAGNQTENESRPYEFSFHVVDFQHRHERKDANGIVTGEYGFITADGVYHEVGYSTDKNDNFIITRMRNRRITSLKDAREIFKDNPEAAKKFVEAVAKACSGCKIPTKENDEDRARSFSKSTEPFSRGKAEPKGATKLSAESAKIGEKRIGEKTQKEASSTKSNKIPEASSNRKGKNLSETPLNSSKISPLKTQTDSSSIKDPIMKKILDKMTNDIYYRFNYTLDTHGHQEDGYRNGKKDGSYRTQSENGVDAQVKYLSNEFGHQPNISFVPRNNSSEEARGRKGYSFLWYWS